MVAYGFGVTVRAQIEQAPSQYIVAIRSRLDVPLQGPPVRQEPHVPHLPGKGKPPPRIRVLLRVPIDDGGETLTAAAVREQSISIRGKQRRFQTASAA